MNVHLAKIIAELTLVVRTMKVLSHVPVLEDFRVTVSSVTTSMSVLPKMLVTKVKSVKIRLVISHVVVHLAFLDLLETVKTLTNALIDQTIAQWTLNAQMLLEGLNALVTLDFPGTEILV